ncbi:MAG: hypothetical protein WC070_00615 [Candidatus Magasanikbacteria bacterium]
MSIDSKDILETEAVADFQFKRILEKGVVIATSSKYREAIFRDIGFKDSIGIPVEQVDEMGIKKEYEEKNPVANEEDPYRTKMVESVARGKVAELMSQLKEHPDYKDKVLVGLDTMPIYFGFDFDENGGMSYRGDAIPKPTPQEKYSENYDPENGHVELMAEEMMEDELTYLVEMIRKKLDEKYKEKLKYNGNTIHRSVGIQVTTGLAIHVPGDSEEIRTFSISSFLEFIKLKEIAKIEGSEKRNIEIKKLVKEIVSQYDDENLKNKISGGINFGDERMKKILDAKEVKLNNRGDVVHDMNLEVESGIYLGAPENAIKQALQYIARQMVTK